MQFEREHIIAIANHDLSKLIFYTPHQLRFDISTSTHNNYNYCNGGNEKMYFGKFCSAHPTPASSK